MKFQELCILLPCHSLEDFPLYHVGDDADSLLACWTGLWHPALLAAAESPPKWYRVDIPPDDLSGKLILVPTVAVAQLPTGFGPRAKEAGALLLRGEKNRVELLDKVLPQLETATAGDRELVADFLALGFAYLQVQVLTRQMRYSSNLDETHFFNQLIAAAKAADGQQLEESRSKLAACFDLLGEERDHYYSVDAYLIDITLVAEQTIGAPLRKELANQVPLNLLLSGRTAESLRDKEPDTWAALDGALQSGSVGLIGGEYEERRLPQLPCEDVLSELRRGQAALESHLGRRAEVFGRRSYGLTPFLPTVLEKLRFRGAMHATMDDGHFPAGSQVKTRWQGLDNSVVDAIAKPPLDATKPETFLGLAQKLGESMDSDHVATLCLAHWPGTYSPWYEDLRRCSRFTSALGKFVTVDRYFADTYQPGHLDRFSTDQYKPPYLRQDVIRKQQDPISSVVAIWRQRATLDAAESLTMLAGAVAGRMDKESSASAESSSGDALADAAARLSHVLPRQKSNVESGYLLFNPWGFVRRVGIDISQLPQLPDVEPPIFCADESAGVKQAVVDLPPMGFAWVAAGSGGQRGGKQKSPVLAVDAREQEGAIKLRNEFFEVAINPVTGALQMLRDYQARGNRLSHQLAMRFGSGGSGGARRPDDDPSQYSVMAADEIRVVTASTVCGEVVSRGRLLRQDGQVVAKFEQTFRVWRGDRVLQMDVRLEPLVELASDPWNSYVCCRFAWPDETTDLFQSLQQSRYRVSKSRIESSLYLDLELGNRRTTLLTGGLPYHRRVGGRMLDTLLIVRGETARQFRLGIGVDLAQPLPDAWGLLSPAVARLEMAAAPVPRNCWLFHIDARSIVPTHWSLVTEGERVVGIRTRLLESAGRNVRARLSAFRPFVAARQLDFTGETVCEPAVQEGQVTIDINAHEWLEIEARWS